jgi:hypothetical protein
VSYDVGSKLKDNDVARYVGVVEPVLVEGEEITAIFWANGLKPMKNALVVTNGRIISISKADLATPAKALRDEVRGGDVTAAHVRRGKLSAAKLVLTLRDGGEREYAQVQKDDADAIERHLAALIAEPAAVATALAAADEERAEQDASRVQAAASGPRVRLHPKANEALDKNLEPGEEVLVVITGPSNQAVIGTDRRAFIYKNKKGFMAGAAFGSEITSWDYRNLVGVQLHTGMMSGALVLQAPGQSGTKTNYWKQGDDDPYKAPNAIPVVRPFDQAQAGVAELRRLIAQADTPTAQPTVPASNGASISDELAKLADLKQQGVLTDEEFAAAKARLLTS